MFIKIWIRIWIELICICLYPYALWRHIYVRISKITLSKAMYLLLKSKQFPTEPRVQSSSEASPPSKPLLCSPPPQPTPRYQPAIICGNIFHSMKAISLLLGDLGHRISKYNSLLIWSLNL